MRTVFTTVAPAVLAGGLWTMLPRWVKIVSLAGVGTLCVVELVKDGNEAYYSAAIFGGQAAQGNGQAADVHQVQNDLAAGKPVQNATATATATYEGLAADAKQKGIYADAATETEAELKAKKAKGIPLSTTEELRLKELRIQESKAIQDEAVSAWVSNFFVQSSNNPLVREADDFFNAFYARATPQAPRQLQTAPRETPAQQGTTVATVIAPELKLRSCPQFVPVCTEVARLKQGERLLVLIADHGNGWAKVQTNDRYALQGYVNAKYLQF